MEYIALGCMTGTSLDGIDCSLIKSDGMTKVSEISNDFTPYSKKLQNELSEIIKSCYLDNLKIFKLLNNEYQNAINNFISKNNKNIDVIGVHGQTIFHDPLIKISIQLYDKKIKYNTQAPIICNFRKNDILNGGSGAPIIPKYHQIIANHLKMDSTVFVNLGGVTNITIIENNQMKAGDTSFGNALINDYLYSRENKEYDIDGNISSRGKKIKNLSDIIQSDEYFKKELPKSLDRNYFHQYLKLINKDYSTEDIIYTLLSIIPESIYRITNNNQNYKIILMGGGRKNLTLVKLFKEKFKDVFLVDDFNFNGDFIESQGMALLAIRYLKKLKSTYKSTTGISKDIYLGEQC
mgnify:CR=1 FL=1|tara:strand:+ start:31 stop:1080 length:1050 start_codon:yes stop_codon:yes gene_type:complete